MAPANLGIAPASQEPMSGPFQTRLTQLLGTRLPIIMGGMTIRHEGSVEWVAAVCNAGCLGLLTALNSGTPEQLRKDIARLRTLTNQPFGVNLTILPSMTPPDYDGFARVITEANVKVVETAGNNPKKWVSDRRAALGHWVDGLLLC